MPNLADLARSKRRKDRMAGAAGRRAAAPSEWDTLRGSSQFKADNTAPLTKSDNDFYRGAREARQELGAPPAWTPTSPGGGGRGRGGRGGRGGGGGGADPRKDGALKQIGFLQDLMRSGAFDPQLRDYKRNDALYGRVDQAVGADKANASGAYDAMDRFLASQGPDAYSQMNPAQGQTADTSSLMALIGAQGGDQRAFQAEGQMLEAGGQQDAASFDRLVSILSSNEQAGLASRQGESAMARAYANNELGAQSLGAKTALDLRESARKESIDSANFDRTSAAQASKVQMATRIAELAAEFGFDAPTMEAMGL